MEVTLSHEEKKEILLTALCNAGHFAYGAMSIDYNEGSYHKAKENIIREGGSQCIEDIWMRILSNGDNLTLVDHEDDSKHKFNLGAALIAIGKMPNDIILDFVNENDDADTADHVLEYICYGEKIYG